MLWQVRQHQLPGGVVHTATSRRAALLEALQELEEPAGPVASTRSGLYVGGHAILRHPFPPVPAKLARPTEAVLDKSFFPSMVQVAVEEQGTQVPFRTAPRTGVGPPRLRATGDCDRLPRASKHERSSRRRMASRAGSTDCPTPRL